MSFTVPLALFGWIPLVLLVFPWLGPRRGVLFAYIAGWCLLPMAGWDLPGLPTFGKASVAGLAAILAVGVYDGNRLLAWRPNSWDLPAAVGLVCGFATSLSNDLGVWEGFSAIFNRSITLGIPWVLGRIYFSDARGMRELVGAVVIGGLLYTPLCLIEVAISPQLHRMVYGYHQHRFLQTIRYGGYRPMVFMQHGLAVAAWIATAAICAFWAWRTGMYRTFLSLPAKWAFLILVIMVVLCRSGNGVILAVLGIVILAACVRSGRGALFLVLVLLPPAYMAVRFTNLLPRSLVIDAIAKVDTERAGSMGARMEQEDEFSRHTYPRWLLGWGGWMRNFPKDEKGKQTTRGVDSLWIITVSSGGVVALASLTGTLLLGPLLVGLRVPVRQWTTPEFAALPAAAMIATLHMVDSLSNAMVNPIFYVTAAGLIGASGRVGLARFGRRAPAAARRSPPRPEVGVPPSVASGRQPLKTLGI